MFLSNNLLAVASMAYLVFVCQALPIDQIQQEEFTLVGTINGKTYYVPTADNVAMYLDVLSFQTILNAYAAEGFCQNFGLELAIFKDREEFSLVRDNVDTSFLYWVGAEIPGQRDFQTRNSFSWHDGTVIGEVNFMQESEHWLCVYLNADRDLMFTDFCIVAEYKPLCHG